MSDHLSSDFYIRETSLNKDFVKGIIDIFSKYLFKVLVFEDINGNTYYGDPFENRGYREGISKKLLYSNTPRHLKQEILPYRWETGNITTLTFTHNERWLGPDVFLYGEFVKNKNLKTTTSKIHIGVHESAFTIRKGDEITDITGKEVYHYHYEGPEGNENVSYFLYLLKSLYFYLKPIYGFSSSGIEIGEYIESKLKIGTLTNENISKFKKTWVNSIPKIFWTNFFSPPLVEKYGQEKLLSAPSWKTEELSDGGIMLVRSPNPFTIDEPYIKAEVIEEYLGIKDQKGG